jgi:hypothetical protein
VLLLQSSGIQIYNHSLRRIISVGTKFDYYCILHVSLDHAPLIPVSGDIHSGGSDKLDSESESSKPDRTGGKPFGLVLPSKFGRMLRERRGVGGINDECDGDDREAWICGFESFGESLIDAGASGAMVPSNEVVINEDCAVLTFNGGVFCRREAGIRCNRS